MPRLGAKYPIEIEVISKPIADYQTDDYFELDLPVAPAVLVGDEIVVEGANVSEDKVEAAICRHLGLREVEPKPQGFWPSGSARKFLSPAVAKLPQEWLSYLKQPILGSLRKGRDKWNGF